jgi:hypothetical protein
VTPLLDPLPEVLELPVLVLPVPPVLPVLPVPPESLLSFGACDWLEPEHAPASNNDAARREERPGFMLVTRSGCPHRDRLTVKEKFLVSRNTALRQLRHWNVVR